MSINSKFTIKSKDFIIIIFDNKIMLRKLMFFSLAKVIYLL